MSPGVGQVPPSFAVIGGREVSEALADGHRDIIALIKSAYRAHAAGQSVNPPSYFLRFPDRPESRIIALPASLGAEFRVDGVKWISSFPRNIDHGLPRASAVLILNDQATGYPFACLESSIISATRTAASAVLAAEHLHRRHTPGPSGRPERVGFFGSGLIARYVLDYFAGAGWSFAETRVFDAVPGYASAFAARAESLGAAGKVVVVPDAETLIRGSELIVLATTAATPHLHARSWFSHNPLVLHLSLRDIAPEIILDSANYVDDVEHCLKANTSLHLAEQVSGGRDFLDGTLHDVMSGASTPPAGRPLVFSPFGLGVLDLAVGRHVYDVLTARGGLDYRDDFFHERDRYGSFPT